MSLFIAVAKKRSEPAASAAGESVAAYGRAAHPLGDRGGLCVAQHGLYNWERPGLYSFFMCRVIMRVAKIVVETEAFRSTMLKEHAETLHGIVRLIIDRVTPFRRPLGIFSSTTFTVSAKQNVVWYPSIRPKLISRKSQYFGSPMLLLTVEGPKVVVAVEEEDKGRRRRRLR